MPRLRLSALGAPSAQPQAKNQEPHDSHFMSSPLFLGLDVGTQSFRAAVIDSAGNCRSFATSPILTTYPQPGWAEQDALEWWQAAREAVPQALAKGQIIPSDIAGIGLDCTACTVLPCQDDGTPLHRALLWMDQRSFQEAA